MINSISLIKLAIAVGIVVAGTLLILALSPTTHGGHDHDPGKIASITDVQKLDAGPSCTHGTNTHRHSGKSHTSKFHNSHRHGSAHHHHGELVVRYDSGGVFSSLYDRQCPKH
jgi:hypothetical protein